MAKKVLVPISEGFEEIEAFTVVDILRRAEAEVVVAGVGGQSPVIGRSNVSVCPDMPLAEALKKGPYHMIFLPGGLPNAHILRDDSLVIEALKEQSSRGGYVGAICAAPLALDRAGLLEGKPHTSHPGVRDQLKGSGYCEDRVVVSGNVLTSRGPGTAMEFAFTIVGELFGEEKVRQVNEGVLSILSV
jgi:DJ-1 family protein